MLQTRILIIDDHPIFSKGLAALLSSQSSYAVAGEAANGREAMKILAMKQTDLAIVDLNLGDEDGLELIKNIHALYPLLKMLVLSMHDERYYAARALKAGACGYIMKEEAGNSVLKAIKVVMSGKLYLSDAENERKAESSSEMADISILSDRQLQIFTFIGQGLGTLEISGKLGLSTKTIETHKEHIKLKLHCATSQDLRQLAVEWTHNSNI